MEGTVTRQMSSSLPGLLLAALITGGCGGPTAPEARVATTNVEAAESQPPPPGDVEPQLTGTIAGHQLTATNAVLLWRDQADDAQLVLGDVENLCDLLSQGAMPGGATLLFVSLKHNAHELRDAPWGQGDYPLRTEGPRAPRDTRHATIRVLDDSCSEAFSARATAGMVRLTGDRAVAGGEVTGELELTFGDESLTGPFTAAVCPQPEMAPRDCR